MLSGFLVMLMAVLWLCAAPKVQAQTLRLVADNSLAAPMSMYGGPDRATLSAGIVKDFGEALARELGLGVQFKPVPTRRTGQLLTAGEGDLLCFYSPVWLDEPASPEARRFVWTSALVDDKDVLIQLRRSPPAQSLAELGGHRVGAIRGYVYPELQRLVDAGQVLRDDTHSIESNLAKLRAGRLYGAIVNEVNFNYLRRTEPALTEVLQRTLTVSSFALSCAVSRRSAVPFERIEAAVRLLVKRGELMRIYARYE